MSESPYLTLTEASVRPGVHPNTLRNWARAGTIVLVRLPGSGHRRVPASEVARVLAAMHSLGESEAMVEPPPTDPDVIAEGRALAETVKREIAEAGVEGTLEECMAGLRGRAWSS